MDINMKNLLRTTKNIRFIIGLIIFLNVFSTPNYASNKQDFNTTNTSTHSSNSVEKDETLYVYEIFRGDNGKYGINNLITEEIIAKPIYDCINNASTLEYAYVIIDNKYGLINCITGKEILPAVYQEIHFSDNYATAKNVDGSYTIIDLCTNKKFYAEKK